MVLFSTRKRPKEAQMGTKLPYKLLDLRFFSALGTTEADYRLRDWNAIVKRGVPNTYAYNQGVMESIRRVRLSFCKNSHTLLAYYSKTISY